MKKVNGDERALGRRFRAPAALVALLSAGAGAGAYVAHEREARADSMREICADDLYVRETKAGIISGTLFRGEHMMVKSYSVNGEWAYGMAYGNVNKHGWVLNGYFCPH